MTSNSASAEKSPFANQVFNAEVIRVSMKLPPFWEIDPATWFVNVETQFALANIVTDETKYNYVVANLDSKFWTEVKEILRNPPSSGKCDKLKIRFNPPSQCFPGSEDSPSPRA